MRIRIRFVVSTALAVAVLLAAQAVAFAHFIWATVENGQARFALLENIGGKPSAQFEKYVAGLTPRSGGKRLALGAAKEGARYTAVPAGQNLVAAESVVGVRERGGGPYLLVYSPKGAASLAAAGTAAKAPAEILARREGDALAVTVRQGGRAVPQCEVWAQWPGEAEAGSAKTDDKGEARFPWPTDSAGRGGFVGVRAMVREAKAGESGGKRYAAVHRWATLTFPVGGPKASGAGAAEKPLTRLLREAYGDNHDVVGGAEFNKTLFAGKLTRAQLESHLSQRALVHAELHRILGAAQSRDAASLPYGPAQKEVLTLLLDDLTALGTEKPTEAQARPLTRDFLGEIRDSEKRGPYFALGVYHVYYGGVTNGGRMIGRKIGETLKFTPAYYAKSDGYREYLAGVNRITDPQAREEMIRGGQAAYRYIIASMNEDLFRAEAARTAPD